MKFVERPKMGVLHYEVIKTIIHIQILYQRLGSIRTILERWFAHSYPKNGIVFSMILPEFPWNASSSSWGPSPTAGCLMSMGAHAIPKRRGFLTMKEGGGLCAEDVETCRRASDWQQTLDIAEPSRLHWDYKYLQFEMFISFSSLSMSIRPLRLNNGYPEKPQSWSMYLFFSMQSFLQIAPSTKYKCIHHTVLVMIHSTLLRFHWILYPPPTSLQSQA